MELKRRRQADLAQDDDTAVNEVVGSVHRHLAQGGPSDPERVKSSRWRYALMNGGHDPRRD